MKRRDYYLARVSSYVDAASSALGCAQDLLGRAPPHDDMKALYERARTLALEVHKLKRGVADALPDSFEPDGIACDGARSADRAAEASQGGTGGDRRGDPEEQQKINRI